MLDRCPQCKSAVIFHRQELGKPQNNCFEQLSKCWKCGFDIAHSPTVYIKTIDYKIIRKWQKLLIKLDNQRPFSQRYQDKLRILHHLCTIIISTRLAPKLPVYLKKKTGIQLNPVLANSIDNCDIQIRKVVVFYSFWLLECFPDKIITAWKNKFIKYNHLLKDFDNTPTNYLNKLRKLNRRST